MRYLILIVTCFVILCGLLVIESGVFQNSSKTGQGFILLQQTTTIQNQDSIAAAPPQTEQQVATITEYDAVGGFEKTITLGSVDPNSGFTSQLELYSKGAAIKRATFSEFDDRDHKDPQPLIFLSSVPFNNNEILSMANTKLILVRQERQLSLDAIHWKSFDKETAEDGSQTACFEALIEAKNTGEPVLKLTKTYKVIRNSYLSECQLTIENLSNIEQKVRFDLAGPCGLGQEAFRGDMRKVMAGFRVRDSQNQIVRADINRNKLAKAKSLDEVRLTKPGADFIWAAAVNKYFAAILVPLPDRDKDFCDWVMDKTGQFYNPDGDDKANSGDETIGLDLKIASNTLEPIGQDGSSKTYNFQLYLGPKDKGLFDSNVRYRELGFVQTIDFMTCCCPASIIYPLAFGVLAIMKWMYAFIHNYGVVIIILVFLMRLIMHPITKKSQVSMNKMTKLGPKAEEIKKKYAKNKAEMNKQLMALYKEQGASPIMGFLPMMVQMPIWLALYSAVSTSIDLRGAGFLPFWITDLSIPDAAWTFPRILTIPLLNWKIESLNLLPILMGVAFYLQQKMMPTQAASANPQMAQQQKMMKIMFPLLFPLMLYKLPSGVNLYIMTSTFAGVIEQHVIRKHIREKEQTESKGLVAATSKTGGKVKKKKPKPFYKT